jgi:hypothetical protein
MFGHFAQPDRTATRLYSAYIQFSRDVVVLSQNKVTTDRSAGFSTQTTPKIERRSNLLAACRELIDLSISAMTAKLAGKNSIDTNLLFDLERAATVFGIDRQILLTAIVNHQLPAAFTDDRYYMKYKDLEQFLDRYYYTKNPMLGTYCPKSNTESPS